MPLGRFLFSTGCKLCIRYGARERVCECADRSDPEILSALLLMKGQVSHYANVSFKVPG